MISFNFNLSLPQSSPEGHKVEDDGHNEDDHKRKPGQKWNTEVEHILDAF